MKPAATVMLLRDTTLGLEVFMLRRTNNAVFAGGMYVFPGGKVDAADGEGDEGYRVAAVRECYEEAGVLLAVDADGRMVDDGHPALAHRTAVYDGDVDVRALAADHGLRLATDALPWTSHWITPKGETARRFDTRFFMAASPAGQTFHHDDNETVASMWVRPADALALGSGRVAVDAAHRHQPAVPRGARHRRVGDGRRLGRGHAAMHPAQDPVRRIGSHHRRRDAR